MGKKYSQVSITVPAGSTGLAGTFDLDQLIRGKNPVIGEVVCLTDLSSLRGKLNMTMLNSTTSEKVFDNIGVELLTDLFPEKVKLGEPGAKYNYEFNNSHSSDIVAVLVFELLV
ncbi:MAG: hypothetical protein CVV49_00090 [Spirochaetae bacterium HGW-Spirochaetae-5]|nr:MAG: hypothetical protein CVV49_00090 [Spirochaetae bacterium HGW-Spirochaetae-5]